MNRENNKEIEYLKYVDEISIDKSLIESGVVQIPSFREWLSYQTYSDSLSIGKAKETNRASH